MMTDLHRTERTDCGQSKLVQRPFRRTDRTPPYRVSGLSAGWTVEMVPMPHFLEGAVRAGLGLSFSLPKKSGEGLSW